MRELGARSIPALLVPEERMAYRILSLNTEKAHNLRERALEAIRMERDLAALDAGPERDQATFFEDPVLLTLGICYEQNGRFAGGVYQPVLKRVEEFLALELRPALAERERRARELFALDAAVAEIVARLKERGFDSPYLKNFVVARLNPLRFHKTEAADWDATFKKMRAAAKSFDTAKVNAGQLARSGGAAGEE